MLSRSLARCCAACAAFAAAHCNAQSSDADPFHWPYATALGSGVYGLGDGTEAQTYRANFSVSLRDALDDRAGVRLLLPVAFGVLTTENAAQAEERALPGAGNKGREAMEVALEMADLLAKLR